MYKAVIYIPRGRVRSYKWVASKIGSPAAYRAVGNALNKNPYPTSVPCHRIIKADGSIGGYYRGRSIKAKLLKAEGIDLAP